MALPRPTEWTVRMFTQGQTPWVSVANEMIYTDFSQDFFWTLRNIRYRNLTVVGTTGANGTVVNSKLRKDDWVGTGHGGEDLKNFAVIVDGQPHDWNDGKILRGAEVTVSRYSILESLAVNAEVVFPASGDRLVENHRYTVQLDLDTSFNFMYAFMHCNDNAFTRWIALADQSKVLSGLVDRDDESFQLNEEVKSVAFFNPSTDIGVCYLYPEIYQGQDDFKNGIWDRTIYNKLYLRPKVLGLGYQVGDSFHYQVTVIPFTAPEPAWQTQALALMKS